MFDAVIDELSQNSSTTLNTVRIVVFQQPMLNDFYTSMQQREAKATKSASWIMSKIKGKNHTGNHFLLIVHFFKVTGLILIFLL